MLQLDAIFHVLLSAALAGQIGDAPGHSGPVPGGTHIVERNLTRLTIAVAILFTANTVVLFHLLK